MEGIEISEEEKQIRSDMAAEVFEGKVPELAAEPEEPEDVVIDPVDEKKEEDPWAGIPAALRSQIESISTKLSAIDNMENRLKQTERRIGSIQNEFQSAAKAAKEVKDAPTKEEMAAAAETEEEWEKLKEDFPDWASAIENRIAKKSAEFQKSIPDVSELRQGFEDVKGKMITQESLEIRLVDFAHPGWKQTIASPEYTAWLATQPAEIQEKHYKGETADDAVDVLNKFKSFQKDKKPTDETSLAKQKRLDAAVTPQSSRKPRMIKSEADMTEQEIRKKEAERLWGT